MPALMPLLSESRELSEVQATPLPHGHALSGLNRTALMLTCNQMMTTTA